MSASAARPRPAFPRACDQGISDRVNNRAHRITESRPMQERQRTIAECPALPGLGDDRAH
jgi:hypothetical protein